MLMSHKDLIKLVKDGVINAPMENVRGTTIDVTLSTMIMVEREHQENIIVDLMAGESINMEFLELDGDGYYDLEPKKFILASTVEVFNLPDNITMEYKLKSTLARNGLEHLDAKWCDPGWHNSTLTLELTNMCNHHTLRLRPGMKIGQVASFQHHPVGDASYAKIGRYNNQITTTPSKGVK